MKKLAVKIVSLLLVWPCNVWSDVLPIKIGAALHLTGEFPTQGAAFREGAELAIRQVNMKGGIKGRAVKLIVEDSQYKPVVAATIAQKFIHVDKVSAAIVGTITEVMASGPLFEKAHIPLIVLWDSAPEIEKIGKYVFAIGAWAPSTGERSATFVFDNLKAKKVVVINTHNEWSLAVTDVFRNKIELLGGKVQKIFSNNPTDPDFRTVLTQVKNLKPDAIYAPVPDNIVSFYKQLRQLNITAPVITSDVLTEELMEQLGDAVEGVYQTQVADPESSMVSQFTDEYKEFFGHEPTMSLFNAWGYDAVNLILVAMKKVGLDPEKIADELYRIKGFSGASGTISINERGSSPTDVSVFQIKNGRLRMRD